MVKAMSPCTYLTMLLQDLVGWSAACMMELTPKSSSPVVVHSPHSRFRRTQYLGEWSAACAMGLITGLAILILQRYLNPDVVHQLLTFNPADFFTCAPSKTCLCSSPARLAVYLVRMYAWRVHTIWDGVHIKECSQTCCQCLQGPTAGLVCFGAVAIIALWRVWKG